MSEKCMVKALYIMNREPFEFVYPTDVRKEIETLADITQPQLTMEEVRNNMSVLKDVEVVFSGWGGPRLDQEFLEAAPNLKALFYAAGSIKGTVTEESWNRNIVVTSAVVANSIPVAEYTLSQVLFSLKGGWQFVREIRNKKEFPHKPFAHIPGGFRSTVGLISLSSVGRMVNDHLKNFDLHVLAYDPFVSEEEAEALGVELCSLDEIFKRSDIVSLHAPLLDETIGMITGDHFAMMKPHSSFINTARGAIVRENEMVEVLEKRSDITAILDVTDPEPPLANSLLYTLPNVVITPHVAGSEGRECGRMGEYMLEEFKRYLKGQDLKWQVRREELKNRA